MREKRGDEEERGGSVRGRREKEEGGQREKEEREGRL